ncbi:LOW QUALITY PROTEIN: hypothetical protein OPAG_02801, partial [Rhodococcus opacus PD630]
MCDDRRRRHAERNFPILAHAPRISPFFGKEEWVILLGEFACVCRREFFGVDLVSSATRTDSAQPPLPRGNDGGHDARTARGTQQRCHTRIGQHDPDVRRGSTQPQHRGEL